MKNNITRLKMKDSLLQVIIAGDKMKNEGKMKICHYFIKVFNLPPHLKIFDFVQMYLHGFHVIQQILNAIPLV